MQIKPKNYIKAQGISKLWQLSENKFRFENKIKHLKGIDQSSEGKGYDGKKFKKTLRIMEKKASMEHQNPILWVIVKKRGIKLGSKSFGGKTNLNLSTKHV